MTDVKGKPCIICVAITGSLPTKENNPAVPISVAEQVESTHEAFEAGATIAHCHVRDDEGKPTSDPERFARPLFVVDGLKARKCSLLRANRRAWRHRRLCLQGLMKALVLAVLLGLAWLDAQRSNTKAQRPDG
jgi:hypothetical protein